MIKNNNVRTKEEIERLKIIKKRVISTATTITLVVGIGPLSNWLNKLKYTNSDGTPKRVISSDYVGEYMTPFKNCYETIVENGKAVNKYKSEYIYYLVNKETNEIGTYVMLNTSDYNNPFFTRELFDFDSEELIMFEKKALATDLYSDTIEGRPYYELLQKENEWIPLTNCSRYIDGGMNIKSTYTKEEIESIKEQVLEGYKIINKSKVLVKSI